MLPAVQIVLKWVLLLSLNIEAQFLTTDHLQNAYLVTADNALLKIDSSGNRLFTYHQNLYGPLKFVDATNPLKLILSYPDYGTVVMLDNTLSEIGSISLKKSGIYNYRALCFSSRNNNIWVFDENDYKLKVVDHNGSIMLESSDMFQQLGYAVHPVYMQEENQFLYLSDPQLGILVFDIYGVYYETLAFRDILRFQVWNEQLLISESHGLYSYHLKTLEQKEITLPSLPHINDVRIEFSRLYILQQDTLHIYQF